MRFVDKSWGPKPETQNIPIVFSAIVAPLGHYAIGVAFVGQRRHWKIGCLGACFCLRAILVGVINWLNKDACRSLGLVSELRLLRPAL